MMVRPCIISTLLLLMLPPCIKPCHHVFSKLSSLNCSCIGWCDYLALSKLTCLGICIIELDRVPNFTFPIYIIISVHACLQLLYEKTQHVFLFRSCYMWAKVFSGSQFDFRSWFGMVCTHLSNYHGATSIGHGIFKFDTSLIMFKQGDRNIGKIFFL
jgi:hypothetical protein